MSTTDVKLQLTDTFKMWKDKFNQAVSDINTAIDSLPNYNTLAPTNHASTEVTYGIGNADSYGHLKLSDAIDSTSGVADGVAATPMAIKSIKATADAAQSTANNAKSTASAAQSRADEAKTAAEAALTAVDNIPLATTVNAGLMQVGDNLSVSNGKVSVPNADASTPGVVISSTTAAANSVPQGKQDGTLDASWEAGSGVTPGSYGPSTNQNPAYGATFSVPSFTVDARGKITMASDKTVKIPAAPSVSEITGNAATSSKLKTPRTITVRHYLTGNGPYKVEPNYTGSGSVSFDGSGNVTISIPMGRGYSADSHDYNCSTD